MREVPITINVDPKAAQAYSKVPLKVRKKLDTFLSIQLLEATKTKESLQTIMKRISQKAQKRGLTPEILGSILDET